jgi:hypothetical protein
MAGETLDDGTILTDEAVNQQPRPEGRGMLFFRGGCTQGFNTF